MPSFQRFTKFIGAAVIVGSGAVFLQAADSYADPFGTCTADTGCRADDATMDFCTPYPWPLAWGNPFGYAMQTLDSQTDMVDVYRPTCIPHTDIGGYLNSSPEFPSGLGPGVRGVWACTAKLSAYVCDRGSLVLNTALLGDPAQRRKTLCHEIGHAAGLSHGSTYGGCMVSGSSTASTYSSHHVAHINAAY